MIQEVKWIKRKSTLRAKDCFNQSNYSSDKLSVPYTDIIILNELVKRLLISRFKLKTKGITIITNSQLKRDKEKSESQP